MGRGLKIRLACAGALLAVGLSAVTIGARLGVVHLNAGEMQIVFGKDVQGQGMTMGIASRECGLHCSFEVEWRPLETGRLNAGMTAGGASAVVGVSTGAAK